MVVKEKSFLTTEPVGVDRKEFDKLIKQYPGAKASIEKDIDNICNYYNKKPFEEREKLHFLDSIKEHVTLINLQGKEQPKSKPELTDIQAKEVLRKCYYEIIEVLKEYCDLKDNYYPITSLWALGTYFHKQFPTYPYLYFNAMKGSGKTRILNLLSKLTYNGKMIISLSEAVLFRTASERTFCIDEFERVGGKEKQALRELLNAAYKKGISVERAKKMMSKFTEKYAIESYELFCPIAIANIWGMEEVLSDRCISLTLEKSNNPAITRKLENFDENPKIQAIKANLVSLVLCRYLKTMYKDIYTMWNEYISIKYNNDTNHTQYIIHTNNTYDSFFNKISDTSLDSRHLELFFPLFYMAYQVDEDVLKEIMVIAEQIVKEKKESDVDESRDVNLIEFVSNQDITVNFIPLKQINKDFKAFYTDEDEDAKWINTRWMGRALKRLNLIKDKKRVASGREVILDVLKAREKIKMFKTGEEK